MATESHTTAPGRTVPIVRAQTGQHGHLGGQPGYGTTMSAARPATARRPGTPIRKPRPARPEPKPRLRQIGFVCAWAALLGFVSLILAVYAFVRLIGGEAPAWYEPAVLATGGAFVLLTVAAFMNVRKAVIPWALLGGASITLTGAFIMTSVAL